MAWIVENRRTATAPKRPEPYLTEQIKSHLAEKFFPRYPTKQAVTLPALHHVQHVYGWIPMQAIEELAEFLGLPAAVVLDTATFYEEFFLKPKGQYLIGVCRSLACEICGSEKLTAHLKQKLGIEVGETTPDGRFTLIEMECLGSCGTAPCALVNDALQEELTIDKIDRLIDSLPADAKDFKDPTAAWDEPHGH